MGYSFISDDTPLMCFNAFHSWKLGWYNDKLITLNAVEENTFQGFIAGFVDYKTAPVVLLQIVTIQPQKYFINYNKKTGFNIGTTEGGNQLLLVMDDGGVGSLLLAKLNPGEYTTLKNVTKKNGDMIIKLVSIDSSKGANIQILYTGKKSFL